MQVYISLNNLNKFKAFQEVLIKIKISDQVIIELS